MVRAFPASPVAVQTQSTVVFTKKYAAAERVLQSFNTWAFKREQPSDPQLMLAFIVRALERHEPIRFVLYWGKGPRHALAGPDVQCLDYLCGLERRVRETYPHGGSINLLFTDTHAKLNGFPSEEIERYFTAVGDAATERGFGCFRLGRIARVAGDTVGCGPHDPFPAETLRRLSRCAEKWYKGDGTAEGGALKYFEMNMREKRAVEQAFPHSIFITFNSSDYRILFPDRLPIFYMYSLKKGVAAKPWFLSEETSDCSDGAGPGCDTVTTLGGPSAVNL
jgi:prepilin-type processing-associated H-X9-DG protein